MIQVAKVINGTVIEIFWFDGAPNTSFKFDSVYRPYSECTALPVNISPSVPLASPSSIKTFMSTEKTLTTNGIITIPHTLSVYPDVIQAFLFNKSPDIGYTIGDMVPTTMPMSYNSSAVIVRVPSVIQLAYKTGAEFRYADINYSSWKLIIKAQSWS